MDVTAACLAEVGYDATTIRQIAKRLGCAVGSIYRYFSDKRCLLDTVSQQMLEPVAIMAEAGEPLERGMAMYHGLATRSPQVYRLMFWLSAVNDKAKSDGDSGLDDKGDTLPGVVKRIIDGWSVLLGNHLLTQRCWATLHGTVLLGQNEGTVLALIRRLIEESHTAKDAATFEPDCVSEVSAEPLGDRVYAGKVTHGQNPFAHATQASGK